MRTTAKKNAGQIDKAKFEDRVRFNWGYHDAVGDKAAGRARHLVESGPQDPKTVSRDFDMSYYSGYQAGLEETEYNGCSEAAWKRHIMAELEKKGLI
jgi:hypothetical protein